MFFKILSIVLAIAPIYVNSVSVDCLTNAYPPPQNVSVSWAIVNLDENPSTRWKNAITPMIPAIDNLLNTAMRENPELQLLLDLITPKTEYILDHIPSEYSAEIRGISNVTNISLPLITMFNKTFNDIIS